MLFRFIYGSKTTWNVFGNIVITKELDLTQMWADEGVEEDQGENHSPVHLKHQLKWISPNL